MGPISTLWDPTGEGARDRGINGQTARAPALLARLCASRPWLCAPARAQPLSRTPALPTSRPDPTWVFTSCHSPVLSPQLSSSSRYFREKNKKRKTKGMRREGREKVYSKYGKRKKPESGRQWTLVLAPLGTGLLWSCTVLSCLWASVSLPAERGEVGSANLLGPFYSRVWLFLQEHLGSQGGEGSWAAVGWGEVGREGSREKGCREKQAFVATARAAGRSSAFYANAPPLSSGHHPSPATCPSSALLALTRGGLQESQPPAPGGSPPAGSPCCGSWSRGTRGAGDNHATEGWEPQGSL